MPSNFFEVRVNQLDLDPSLIALCVGYELGEWRYDALVDYLMEWMPEFCLTYGEVKAIDSGNMVTLMREAVRKLYTSGKFKSRGEFGELILHAAIRSVFNSMPAISKIYYKSATNDTVKGFDAVHVVPNAEHLELWLGEVKFYKDLNAAIRDVIPELHLHLNKDYLRVEFLLIRGKIDDAWPHAEEVRRLLDPNVSLDDVFNRVVIPVLLTYDSKTISDFAICNDIYRAAFEEEITASYKAFCGKELPQNITICLFLVPLKSKELLVEKLDNKLKIWQSI
jgi:hypothetical protein